MQRTRTLLQLTFLAITVVGVFLIQGNAERWCPFGGVEALYTYFADGAMPCSLAFSNFLILGGVLLATLLVRRAFCSYACPIGAISEWFRSLGRGLRLPLWRPSRRVDCALSLGKYVVLVVVLYLTYRAGELMFRGFDPCYALLSRHGEDITFWAYVVTGAILVGSLVSSVPFCRWLCPLAAVLQPFSRVSPARVTRDTATCIDCGECSLSCPMEIPVDEVEEVTHARCTSCLSCTDACPAHTGGAIRWTFAGRRMPRVLPAAVLLLCLTVSVGAAVLFPFPSYVLERGEVPADAASVVLKIPELSCRGKATALSFFLLRDDISAVPGPLKVEAWPGPDGGEARISFDGSSTSEIAILEAITEPLFDASQSSWRMSPFTIEGYDPFAELRDADPAAE